MAALVTPYSVGNQAAMIRRAFTPQSMAGLAGLQGTGITSQIIDAVSSFVGSRWGQQRGTITMNPDGTITQKQAAGYPINTQAPIYGGGAYNVQAPEGFATGIATGTLVAVGIGALVLVVLMSKGRR